MPAIWDPQEDAETARWRAIARTVAREQFAPAAEEIDRDARYPTEHVETLVSTGLAGMFVPREHGGAGASLTATCAAMEELAHECATGASLLAAYVLGAYPVLLAGTPEQREAYLRPLATEGRAVSFALTERGAGSDPAGMETAAVAEGDGYRLRGEKWFIGNGGASQSYIVFARTATDDRGRARLTAFALDRDDPGLAIDEWVDKMGIRGTKTSNVKLDAHVSPDAVVGELGRGLRLALGTLTVGRIATAAQCLGIARGAFDASAERAISRRTFGAPIIDNQGVSFPLADVATELSAARMLLFEAARAFDAGADTSVLGPMAKLYASNVAHRAVDVGVQVFGGSGFCRPQKVERFYRDQRIFEIVEGTSEIQRLVIGRALKTYAQELGAAGQEVAA